MSKLHGRVSRNMWHWLWPNRKVEDVPITSITNGVHTGTWLAPELHAFYDKYLGAGWYDKVDDPETWKPLYNAPDDELWAIHAAAEGAIGGLGRARNWARGMLAPVSPSRYLWSRCLTLMP